MLAQRLLSAIVLLPVGIGLILLGGWAYAIAVVLILAGAGWEYWRIFRQGGYSPSAVLIIGGVALLALARMALDLNGSAAILAGLVLASMAVHVIEYDRGQEKSATDFAIDLGGIMYLGWIGSYLIDLRNLPDGKWLVLLALPSVWLADTAAYLIGRQFGRHKIAPRASPGKSWEGYIAGIIFGIPATGLLALLWSKGGASTTFIQGMVLGLVLATITPLGDLGESMIKRQFGVKDSSHLIPGHGGIMDRIDSWLWAVVISYYLFRWFW